MSDPVGRYTVAVAAVPLQELLHALARDAGLNMDIDPALRGEVTLHAVDQPLVAILERLARQLDIRYQFVGDTLLVSRDAPYFRQYQVDYLNLSRATQGAVSVSTQISSGGGGEGSQAHSSNVSTTSINAESQHDFWGRLRAALSTLLGLSAEDGGAQGADSLVMNPEAGLITVKATARQHVRIESLLDELLRNIRRQVLIQATVVEVALRDEFRAGINWSKLSLDGSGLGAAVDLLSGGDSSLMVNYLNEDSDGSRLQAAISLLSEFGETRVLSSPQIMVLNNHTAVLKVVENFVYFEVQQDLNAGSAVTGAGPLLATTTVPRTIPVGLIMTVTPQIGGDHSVILNVRPTVSSVVRTERDPNPSLSGVENLIPVVRVREMESVLRVRSNQIAILGGLMQDTARTQREEVPFIANLPLIGRLFQGRHRQSMKTELVIFMRPIVMSQPV